MRIGITSDLLRCMDSDLHETNSVHVADAIIVMVNHGTSIMFQDLRQSVLIMHLCSTSTELFAFLSLEVVRLPLAESNELYATDGSGVLCSPA